MAKTKRLSGFVYVTDDEGNTHTYGPDDKVPAEVAKNITNPSAWEEVDVDEDDPNADVVRGDQHTRLQLLNAAERAGLEPGKDFPVSASKDVIAAMIRRKLFEEDNPEAELVEGSDPVTLAGVIAGEETGGSRRRSSAASTGE